MKKILCLFLAALMCLSTLAMAACGVGDDQKEDGSNNGEGVTEVVSEDPNYACGLPDDLNFGGDTINFLFANRPGREDELVSEGGMESGAIGSAVYERNVTVEERLKVKLNMIPNNDDSVSNSLKMDYTSGTGDYDLVADGTYKAIIPVI